MAKVLIDCERCRKRPCGLQYYCDLLVGGLRELRDDIVAYGPCAVPGVPQIAYRALWKHGLNPYPRRFALTHLTHQGSKLAYGAFARKVLLTVHDVNYLKVDEVSAFTKHRWMGKVARNLRLADRVVCISQTTRRDLLEVPLFRRALADKPVDVIYNGLAFPTESLPREALPEPLALQRPYILNIGESKPKKNQLTLVRMLPYIEEDVVLVLNPQDNAYAVRVQEEASRLGVGSRLHVYSYVGEGAKQALLQFARAMVHPSLAEGFGYTPVEQMYHRHPVFLSRCGSLPEIGGGAAYYFADPQQPEQMAEEYRRGMADYIAHRAARDAALRSRAEEFSQGHMAQAYSRIYDELLQA